MKQSWEPRPGLLGASATAGVLFLGLTLSIGADPAASTQAKNKPVPPPASAALLKVEEWQHTPLTPVSSKDIDRLVAEELKKIVAKKSETAPRPLASLTTDEQFLRRVTLDLTGRLPTPAVMEAFLTDTDPNKRAKQIDHLLDSEAYALHWARFWTDVIAARSDRYMKRLAPLLEEWLFEQFQQNRTWGDIVRAMLTAEAVLTDLAQKEPVGPKQPINGAAYFVATRYYEKTRTEGAIDAAAETARIFLGIQLQCAQCHDHPFDQWERVQFHQLAAFFARSGGRPKHAKFGGQGALDTWALVYYPDGEYDMPHLKDPAKLFVTHPAFLDGATPGEGLSDQDRRQALANVIVDQKNYWFAAAYINRIWCELMGQAFYQPVDDMGPMKEAVAVAVLTRLTGAFRGSNYDMKGLFRVLMNTQTYQRQSRMGQSADEHLYFTALAPSRLRADVLWRSLSELLEPKSKSPSPKSEPAKRFARPTGGPQAQFLAEFDFDPSLRPEKTLPQVLLLMNSPMINNRIAVGEQNLLGQVLKEFPQDRDALRYLYQRAFARKPTDRELQKCEHYIEQVGKRAEAFEDILWALINSPEFQVKR